MKFNNKFFFTLPFHKDLKQLAFIAPRPAHVQTVTILCGGSLRIQILSDVVADILSDSATIIWARRQTALTTKSHFEVEPTRCNDEFWSTPTLNGKFRIKRLKKKILITDFSWLYISIKNPFEFNINYFCPICKSQIQIFNFTCLYLILYSAKFKKKNRFRKPKVSSFRILYLFLNKKLWKIDFWRAIWDFDALCRGAGISSLLALTTVQSDLSQPISSVIFPI